jgi:2-polyprenyl-6-methoxyphenol hydroxylase-like FAD-dependent oxidoreductase
MTDAKGTLHNHTVTADLLRPEAWSLQLARRKDMVSPSWHRLFAVSTASRLPLLTAIRSFDNTSAFFFDQKLLLVGEAFSLIRPHMGASCSIPALQALTLVEVLKGEKTWNEVEKEVVAYSTKQATVSEATGVFGMTGKWKF